VANLLDDLLTQVRAVDESIRKKGGIAWYRGHPVADWELTSDFTDTLRDCYQESPSLRTTESYCAMNLERSIDNLRGRHGRCSITRSVPNGE
jgi:hypothetical protein